jgi:2-isopropylmalate synthase
VECTINGIGERAGNASLEELVMAMRVRPDRYPYYTRMVSERLFPASQLLSEIVGFPVQPNKAIVGRNAFAHEAGIHQDGMIKNSLTYEIMTPQSVGVPGTSFVLGKHSGRHALGQHCEALGYHLDRRELDHVYRQFLAVADDKKIVGDSSIVETIRAMRRGDISGDMAGPSQSPMSSAVAETAFETTNAKIIFPYESEQQEDYLWGV